MNISNSILDLTFEELKQKYEEIPVLKIPSEFWNKLKKASLLIKSLDTKENILIFTDSNDLDGVAGGVILYLTLKHLKFKNIKVYGTGDRNTLPKDINDYSLVITNDVGINIDFSNYKNNLIVLDHHQIVNQNKQNLNQKQIINNQNQIFICQINICGAYISYLLCSILLSKLIETNQDSKLISQMIFEYAALATISDCMPINDINKQTIQQLNSLIINTEFTNDSNYNNIDIEISDSEESKFSSNNEIIDITSKALYSLLNSTFINKYSSFNLTTLSFNVIPKLNAPMKLNNDLRCIGEYLDFNTDLKLNWQFVFKFLIECDDNKINEYSEIITKLNNERKAITTKIFNDIVKLYKDSLNSENEKSNIKNVKRIKHCVVKENEEQNKNEIIENENEEQNINQNEEQKQNEIIENENEEQNINQNEEQNINQNINTIENSNKSIVIRYSNKVIDVYDKNIKNHITGQVANKLTEYFKIPVAVRGELSSSIRGENALKILEMNSSKLKTFGGHAEAAGFQLQKDENLDLNVNIFDDDKNENIENENKSIGATSAKNENISNDDKININNDNENININDKINISNIENDKINTIDKINNKTIMPSNNKYTIKTNIKLTKNTLIKWREDYNYLEIKEWIMTNSPFCVEPIFIKNAKIKNMRIFKNAHTKIIDSDNMVYMIFNKVLDSNISNLNIKFKITGNDNNVIDIF